MAEISWDVLAVVAVVLVIVEAGLGMLFVAYVWPWTRRPAGRKTTEWMLLSFMVTTPLMLGALAVAAIGGRPGDVAGGLACVLMWIGQLPFMFAGLPVLDWALAKERAGEGRGRRLEAIADGDAE